MADISKKPLNISSLFFSALTPMMLAILSLNFEDNFVFGISTKTNYLVSTNTVNYHTGGIKNCFLKGGVLINLESPLTRAFLNKFRTALDLRRQDETKYYTGLRYNKEVFYWADDCTLANEEEVETYANVFDETQAGHQVFQIRYMPDSSGTLGEEFDGFWGPHSAENRILCQIDTTEDCTFVEMPDVEVDSDVERRVIYSSDLNTCRSLCLLLEFGNKDCLIYHHELDVCTLWLSDNDLTGFMSAGPLTVHYKDCVGLEFFEAIAYPAISGFQHCQPQAIGPLDQRDFPSLEPSTLDSGDVSSLYSISTTELQTEISTKSARAPSPRLLPGDMNKMWFQPAVLEPDPPEMIAADRPVQQGMGSAEEGIGNFIFLEMTTLGVQWSSATIRPSSASSNQFSLKATNTEFVTIMPILEENTSKKANDILDPALPIVSTVQSVLLLKPSHPGAPQPNNTMNPLGTVSTCPCVCGKGNNDSQEEKAEFTAEIVSNLTIDKKNTSANIRKFVSAKDDRPSTTRIGGFGAIFLGLTLSIPVLLDLSNLIVYIANAIKNSRGRTGVIQISVSSNEN